MKKSIFCINLFFILFTFALPISANAAVVFHNGTNYTLNNHPRLLLEPTDLTILRAKANNQNFSWSAIESWCASFYAKNPDPTKLTHTSSLPVIEYTLNFGLMYLIDPIAYKNYGLYLKQVMLNYTDPTKYDTSTPTKNPNRDYGSLHLGNLALAYDWIYPLIKDDELFKNQFLTWLNDVMIPMVHQHEQILAAPPNGYSESNLAVTKWAGELMIALATYEDNTDGVYGSSGNSSSLYLKRKWDFWDNELKPLRDIYYRGGHTWDGSHYAYARSLPQLFFGLESLRTALGVDYFSTLRDRWDKDFLEFFLHAMMPDNIHYYSEGILAEDNDFHYGRVLIPYIFSIYKNKESPQSKYGQHFIKNIIKPNSSPNTLGEVSPYYLYYWFLWYDNDYESTNYTIDFFNGYHAIGVDLVLSRSSWSNPDSTHISFACADMIHGTSSDTRQGMNPTSYKIWKKDYLLYENGKAASGVSNGGDEAPFHNTIFINDGYIENDWGSKKLTGGFLQKGGTYLNGKTIYPKSNITKSEFSNFYSYSECDASQAYTPNLITSLTRSLVHSLPTNQSSRDYLIVLDRIKSAENSGPNSGAALKTSYLHVPTPPVIADNKFTVNSASGTSKLDFEVLLPVNPKLVASSAQDLTQGIENDSPWTIRISAPISSDFENFLFVYFPTANLQEPPPPSTLISTTNSNMLGAVINDPDEQRLFLFSSEPRGATILGEITYQIQQTTSNMLHYLYDLKPNSFYNISLVENGIFVEVNITPGGQFQTTGKGVLTFSSTKSMQTFNSANRVAPQKEYSPAILRVTTQ